MIIARVGVLLAAPALGLALVSQSPAQATQHRIPRHEFCLPARPHLCMAALHPGVNSRIVLRPPDNTRAEDIQLDFGQLRFMTLPDNMCIGRNARTVHCSTPGTGWQGEVTVNSDNKFWNVAATVHDPDHRAHWLTASVPAAGRQVIVSTNWHLHHTWWDCLRGHCP